MNHDYYVYPASEHEDLSCCEGHIDGPPDCKTQDNFLHIFLEKKAYCMYLKYTVGVNFSSRGV
jgi:hypothetical protein